MAYDCHGAGQKVTQVTFKGRNWRSDPGIASQIFEAFMVMRQLHEQMMYLNEGLKLAPPAPIKARLERQLAELDSLTRLDADRLIEADVSRFRASVDGLLIELSSFVRERGPETP